VVRRRAERRQATRTRRTWSSAGCAAASRRGKEPRVASGSRADALGTAGAWAGRRRWTAGSRDGGRGGAYGRLRPISDQPTPGREKGAVSEPPVCLPSVGVITLLFRVSGFKHVFFIEFFYGMPRFYHVVGIPGLSNG
jgi:hypothetical protein